MFELAERIRIERPAELVRAQFADVAYHEASGPHRGVRFEVIADSGQRCEYEQVTRVGPVRSRQRFVLDRTDPAHQVNSITDGLFRGGSITFDISRDGDASVVTAKIRSRLNLGQRMVKPILRRTVRRSLARALAEDRADLESGRYESVAPRPSA